jgi:phosphoglycerate dehydrogenase-like enzyme
MKIISLFPAEHHDAFWTDANRAHAARLGDLVAYPAAGFSAAEFIGAHSDAEVLLTTWDSPRIDAGLIAALPRLKVLGHAAGSVRSIFDAAAWDRDIVVLTGARSIGRFVGEMTLTLALCGLRRVVEQHHVIQNDGWRDPELIAQTLFGARVGLAGFGFTARHAARLLKVFTDDIHAYDPFVSDAEMRDEGVQRATLEEIFSTCKVISLHLPNFAETRNIVNGALLHRMQAQSVLVNTSRGAVIATDELVSFLRERPDVVALLDVTEPEPPPAGHALRTLPNIVLTPHISGAQDIGRPDILHSVLDDLEAVLGGRTPLAAVTAEIRERMA